MGFWQSLFGSDRLNVAKRFEIQSDAAAGTMSRVHKVREHATGKIFALKLLDPAKVAEVDRKFVATRPSEAEVLSSIQHPHVVAYFEHGTTDRDEPYILMEWLAGPGVHAVLKTLTDPQRIGILKHAAQALWAVHRAGFVHRDVCPHNLVASPDLDSCKLIDFGLAIPDKPEFQTANNRTGKIDYMAPELLKRLTHDASVDVYAFGVTAYQICTGRLPWKALGSSQSFSSATRDPISIRVARPDIDERLATAITGCLAPEPRYRPSFEAFLGQLRVLG